MDANSYQATTKALTTLSWPLTFIYECMNGLFRLVVSSLLLDKQAVLGSGETLHHTYQYYFHIEENHNRIIFIGSHT
jgi:hypothetical protein